MDIANITNFSYNAVARTMSDLDVIRNYCNDYNSRWLLLWGAVFIILVSKIFIHRRVKKYGAGNEMLITVQNMFDDIVDVSVLALCIINMILIFSKFY